MAADTRIVILDAHTANPGDLSWEPLRKFGDVQAHQRTPIDQIVHRAQNAACLLTNKTPLSADTLAQLPDLRYIGVLATGCNVVDIDAARDRGVTVTNVPAYSTESVAQLATGLMLELARGIGAHDRAVHDGQWARSEDFCFTVTPQVELTGKTLGVIGLGSIGLAFAKIAHAMGMRIVASTRTPRSDGEFDGVPIRFADTDAVFAEADVLSLHCPLTPQTERLVDARRLGLMKRSALLINTGRGQLIDDEALAAALRDGRIAGAAVDVLVSEPPAPGNPLLSAPRCVITPHIAWTTREARQRLVDTAIANVEAFLAGRPQNVVS